VSEDQLACRADEAYCITCGDEGIEMRVIELRDGLAVCADADRTRHRVAVDLIGPLAIGDSVLVHAGVAIAQLQTAHG
jgi:hydrogenase maturation factor